MSPSGWLLLISTLAFFAGLWVTWLVHSRVRMDIIVSPAPPFEGPRVSVIVPARNEARNIRKCVTALLEQTYPALEVIVVDDRSTDATPQILADLRKQHPTLRVIESKDLPPGWAGKPHALSQGAGAAAGEWLCFVDADTFARPALVASTLKAAQDLKADLLSILTDQEMGSFWEKTILPLVFTGLSFGFPAKRVNDPDDPVAIANGQFILVKKAVYAAIGGHAAVKGRVDEDKAIAEQVKRAGYRLLIADGRSLASTRMYTSLPEMWEGWTKNIYLGMRDQQGVLLFGAAVGLIAALAMPAWLAAGLVWLALDGGWIPAVVVLEALGLWAYLLAWRTAAARAYQISPLYAFTLPLGALVFTAMMFASAYKVISGKGVSWKGRVYR